MYKVLFVASRCALPFLSDIDSLPNASRENGIASGLKTKESSENRELVDIVRIKSALSMASSIKYFGLISGKDISLAGLIIVSMEGKFFCELLFELVSDDEMDNRFNASLYDGGLCIFDDKLEFSSVARFSGSGYLLF